jgi:type VII secretion protein EccB
LSSKRDLVEAHGFNRRRLATAFVSGAPGGREVEPVRLGRAVVGGVVLAVLVVAGAAVAGFLKPTLPDDWDQQGLVIGEESGSRFLAYDGEFFPVVNATSARLVLDDFDVTFVPDAKIAEKSLGATLGIPGAPDALPPAEDLVQTGWTACADVDGATRLRLAEQPGARVATDQALVVRSDQDETWVVTGGYRYEVPRRTEDPVLRALGLDGAPRWTVSGTWLDLFPVGGPLEGFSVPGAGEATPDDWSVPAGAARVGSVLDIDGQPYVLGQEGIIRLTEFASAVYLATSERVSRVEASTAETNDIPQSTDEVHPTDWPTEVPAPFGADFACALLATEPGQTPTVSLAAPTAEEAVPGDGESGTSVSVEPGRGALVRTMGSGVTDQGTVYLVDASGTHYAIGGEVTDTLSRLGYSGVQPVPVPLLWADLFASGPELSREQAVQPVRGRT